MKGSPKPDGRTVLAVASGGGHLTQLTRLLELVPDVGRTDWLTYDTGLGRELVERCGSGPDRVAFAPAAAPRELPVLLADAAVAWRILRRNRYDLVVSTGGAVALTVLPLTRAMGIPTCYIESATRSQGPSTTGRVLARVPGIRCFTQYRAYEGPRWSYVGSVFDDYEPGPPRDVEAITRVLVTIGTLESHDFARLTDRVRELHEPSWHITWQIGAMSGADLPGDVHRSLPAESMRSLMAEVDVVISHAGTGTALTAFDQGVCPVLVPRRSAHGEHVDDHQALTTAELTARGLAVGSEADDLTHAALLEAARRTVRRRQGSVRLDL